MLALFCLSRPFVFCLSRHDAILGFRQRHDDNAGEGQKEEFRLRRCPRTGLNMLIYKSREGHLETWRGGEGGMKKGVVHYPDDWRINLKYVAWFTITTPPKNISIDHSSNVAYI